MATVVCCEGNPARPGSDDVKQGQPIGAGDQRVGQGKRARFELERLGELGPKEQRPFQAQVLKRRRQHVVHRDNLGGTANRAGVLAMGISLALPAPSESTLDTYERGVR